jgi:DNA processing protein
MVDDKQLRAYLKLHLAEGVGAILFGRLVEAFGDVTSAAAAGPAGWQEVQGVGEKTAAALAAVTDEQIDAELADAAEHGVTILCRQDDRYPAALGHIPDPPAVLYVRGRLEPADAIAVAIVGSRRCTYYGLEQAERFGQLLGRAGFTVVSGGARGIDTAAHRGALAGGGRTIAVMGCGLCHTYPPENA